MAGVEKKQRLKWDERKQKLFGKKKKKVGGSYCLHDRFTEAIIPDDRVKDYGSTLVKEGWEKQYSCFHWNDIHSF